MFDFQTEEKVEKQDDHYPEMSGQTDDELKSGLILLIILTVSIVGASWLFLLPVYFDIRIAVQLMPLVFTAVLLFLALRVNNTLLNKAIPVLAFLFGFTCWSCVIYLNLSLPPGNLSTSEASLSGISNSMYLVGLCFLVLWSSRYILYAQYLSALLILSLVLLLYLFTPITVSFLLAVLLLTGYSVVMSVIASRSPGVNQALEDDTFEMFNEELLLTPQIEEEVITPELAINVIPLTPTPVAYDWEKILRELNGQLKNTADVDQLFKRMLAFLQNAMVYESAAVGMLQDNSIKKIATNGANELLGTQVLSWTNQRVKAVFLSREAVLSKQAHQGAGSDGSGTLHRLDIPVLSGQKVVGLVTLFRQAQVFDTNDVKLAASVVFHAMISLREARLQLEVKRLSTDITPTKLTLYSREQFVSKAKPVFKKLGKPRECSLFIVEIDNFDEVVDSTGRDAGVLLYKAVSRTIMSELRNEDVFGRYGNEGFVVLLDETDMNHAKSVAENVRLKASELKLNYQDSTISTTLSIGLTIVSDDKEDLPALMRKADMGLFIAKESGYNTVKVSL